MKNNLEKLRAAIDGDRARKKPGANRCFDCGRYIGERFTGYDRDRFSDRGRLFCDRCVLMREGIPS